MANTEEVSITLSTDKLDDDQLLALLIALTTGYNPQGAGQRVVESGIAVVGEAWARGLLTRAILEIDRGEKHDG